MWVILVVADIVVSALLFHAIASRDAARALSLTVLGFALFFVFCVVVTLLDRSSPIE